MGFRVWGMVAVLVQIDYRNASQGAHYSVVKEHPLNHNAKPL